MGAVEIYNRGRWGAVCIGGGDTAQFTIDAQVACRQLGFRFGVMFQVGESSRFPYDYIEYSFGQDDGIPSDFAWASEVVCTGTEERLDRCLFTEGSDNTLGGLPDEGVLDSCFRTLPVVCTQFELIGALTAVCFFAATMVCIRPYASFGMHCGVRAMQCAVEEATHAFLATWRFASSQRFLRCHVNTCWLVQRLESLCRHSGLATHSATPYESAIGHRPSAIRKLCLQSGSTESMLESQILGAV